MDDELFKKLCAKIDGNTVGGKAMYFILDDMNNPIPCAFEMWCAYTQLLMDKPEMKRVALSDLPNYRISTVFLSVDHSFEEEDYPLIFETMVFKNGTPESIGSDCYMDRYQTWEEAETGHATIMLDLINGTLELY